MKAIVYKHRGRIERGGTRGYRWTEGYSEDGERGPSYPWMTRRECQEDARRRGATARFER